MRTNRALHCDHPGCTAESPFEPPKLSFWARLFGLSSALFGGRQYLRGTLHAGWKTVPVMPGRPPAHYCPEHAGNIRKEG
jgi:hypothetical protein